MRTSLHLRRGLAAALAAGALVAAGCGEKTLDTGDAEQKISDSIFDQRKVRVDVSCPDDMKAKKGQTYTCEAKANGQDVKVKLEMLDDDGRFEMQLQP